MIDVAVKLFSEKGYTATSVQDVADELGMLKGSLYYYIDTKETLLRRIFETSHEEVREIAERNRNLPVSAVERLSAFLTEYAMWYLTNLERASLFAREWRYASGDLRSTMNKQRRYYDEVLEELIAAVSDEGRLRDDIDVKLATYYVLSAVSALPDWFRPHGGRPAQVVAEQYTRMSLDVLLTTDA